MKSMKESKTIIREEVNSSLTTKHVNKEITEFIKRRFPQDSNWCNGNCYWFSVILHNRFPQYDIYLFPIENHFMIGDGKEFYDWQGLRPYITETPILWDKVKEYDEAYYNRIVRDCIT